MTGTLPAAAGAWSWHVHFVVWAVVAGASLAAVSVHRRLARTAPHPEPWPTGRAVRFAAAMVLLGLSMGWPLGDLAARWSLSALVLQRCLLVLAVAPLLLAGLPDDLIRWSTRPAPVDALLLRVLRPPVAVVTVTVLLVGSMLPVLVAAESGSPLARSALALVVLVAGLVLWLPVLGRIPGIARPRPMIRAVYLVAQAVVPVFLSFLYILATQPLYPSFARSGDAVSLRPLNDQQVAGFISKLSFVLVLLAVAGVVLARAPESDDDLGAEDPLSWADVERHFERADRRGTTATGSPSPRAVASGDEGGTGGPANTDNTGSTGGRDGPGAPGGSGGLPTGPAGDAEPGGDRGPNGE